MPIDFFKARTSSDFDIGRKYREYAINESWRENAALWRLISSMAGEPAARLYRKVVDLVKNLADVEQCEVRQLESMSYQFGIDSGFGFTDSLPASLYDLMNDLSVRQSRFMEAGQLFTAGGLEEIVSAVPEAAVEVVGEAGATMVDAMREATLKVVRKLAMDGAMGLESAEAVAAAVSQSSSLADVLSGLVGSGTVTQEQSSQIMAAVVAEILDAGRIGRSEYLSGILHGSSLANVEAACVSSAVEFSDRYEEGRLVHDWKVLHLIEPGTPEDLEEGVDGNVASLLRGRFTATVMEASPALFRTVMESVRSLSAEVRWELALMHSSGFDTAGTLKAALASGLIGAEQFSDVSSALSTIDTVTAVEDRWNNSEHSEVAAMLASAGCFPDGDGGARFLASAEESGDVAATVRNYVRTGLMTTGVLDDRQTSPLFSRALMLGTYESLDRFGQISESLDGGTMYYGYSGEGRPVPPSGGAGSFMASRQLGAAHGLSVGTVPAGATLFVLVPEAAADGYGAFGVRSGVRLGLERSAGTVEVDGEQFVPLTATVAEASRWTLDVDDLHPTYSGIKLGDGARTVFVFVRQDGVRGTWKAFRSLDGRFGWLKLDDDPSDGLALGSVAVLNGPGQSVRLPAGRIDGDLAGVVFDARHGLDFVGAAAFMQEVVRKSYYDAVMDTLSCTLNAGNAEDLSVYRDDFMKYAGEGGFSQYVADRNVNGQFLAALEMSSFCSNLCEDSTLRTDWFLDSDLHYSGPGAVQASVVVSQVADALVDMTLAVVMRRLMIRRTARRYSEVGSVHGLEKTAADYVLRNFTSRRNDWGFSSGYAVDNDQVLPDLAAVRDRFSVKVKEYYDVTEYLNISAESADRQELRYRIVPKVSASINASGEIETGPVNVKEYYWADTGEPLVTGGNAPFWEGDYYRSRLLADSDDVVEFYRNVDGAGSMGNLGDALSISAVFSRMWRDCAVSSLIPENEEMHRKYIGDGTGYATAVNAGNPDYPTIAPLPTLTNLVDAIGSLERDYQSVVNDDRPDVVEGVAPRIVDAYYYVPLKPGDWGTEGAIVGRPPFLQYAEEDYLFPVTTYYPRTVTRTAQVTMPGAELVSSVIHFPTSGTVMVAVEGCYPVTQYAYDAGPSAWYEGLPEELPSGYSDDDYAVSLTVLSTWTTYLPFFRRRDITDGRILVPSGYVSGAMPPYPYDVPVITGATLTVLDPDPPGVWEVVEGGLSTMRSELDAFVPDLSGGPNELDPVRSQFSGLYQEIVRTSLPWFYDNVFAVGLEAASSRIGKSSSAQWTVDPSEDCYVITDGRGNVVEASTFSQVFDYFDAVVPDVTSYLDSVQSPWLTGMVEAAEAGKTFFLNGADAPSGSVRSLFTYLRRSWDVARYGDEAAYVEGGLESEFHQVTAGATLASYNQFAGLVGSELAQSDAIRRALAAYDSGEPVEVVIASGLLHEFSAADLVDYVGSQNLADMRPALDEVDFTVCAFTSRATVQTVVTGYVDGVSYVPSTWHGTGERIEWLPRYDSDVLNVDYTYVEMVPSVSTYWAYKVLTPEEYSEYVGGEWQPVPEVAYATVDMFDGMGGLKNSWRNTNVELCGYSSCYEASPNLDSSYTEDKYVDMDGPWIGEALYDLIASITPVSGASGVTTDTAMEPEPWTLNVDALKADHYYVASDGVKDGKWWLPDYVEALDGCDLADQLPFYLPDILALRTSSVFEVEVDSYANSYTLYKARSDEDQYDSEGVLWMRHHNFPFSFPVVQPPRPEWDDAARSEYPDWIGAMGFRYELSEELSDGARWVNPAASPSAVTTASRHPSRYDGAYYLAPDATEAVAPVTALSFSETQEALGGLVDQVFVGYVANEYRSILSRCLAFGVNNASLWVAGYDGRNPDGSDHFNLRIVRCGYFSYQGRRFYGNRSPRLVDRLNPEPLGYDSAAPESYADEEPYRWLDFCGGYYDGDVINFVFWGDSGFRFKVYSLSTGRFSSRELVATFPSPSTAAEYAPTVEDGHNPFRLVEDVSSCYVGWVSGDRFVVCRNDKDDYRFSSLVAWTIPAGEPSRQLCSFAAGSDSVKVQLKSGNVYYARLSSRDFGGNEGVEELVPESSVALRYVTYSQDADAKVDASRRVVLPRIPLIGLTQWRNWAYTLTDNSLLDVSYEDAMNVSAMTSSSVNASGYHYDVMRKRWYVPGNMRVRGIVSYRPDSGELEENGRTILTGYDIGEEFEELAPDLQPQIPAWAPEAMASEVVPDDDPAWSLLHYGDEPRFLSAYYGLPYNSLYAERTDLADNREWLLDGLDGLPSVEANFMTLKNFYDYMYEHEYSWNNRIAVTDERYVHKVMGWRRYLKCSISRYSDAMWMSYRYLRDWQVLPQSNKQQSVAKVLNDYEFVEVVYGTIQLMNNAYSKASVFDLEVNDSHLQGTFFNDVADGEERRASVRRQIVQDLRTMADRTVPAHMQLYRVRFSDDYVDYGDRDGTAEHHSLSVASTVMPRVPFRIVVVSSERDQEGSGSYVAVLSSGRDAMISSLRIGQWSDGIRIDEMAVSVVDPSAGTVTLRLTLGGRTAAVTVPYSVGAMAAVITAEAGSGSVQVAYSLTYLDEAGGDAVPYDGGAQQLPLVRSFELFDGSQWEAAAAVDDAGPFVHGVMTGTATVPYSVPALKVRMRLSYAGEDYLSNEADVVVE